mmetsp:Transcript_15767/g.22425  ORF Transcript_15767/g.22425 Transcript_15767/m.22425 type:complete len:203 (+) Transcript_15767:2357-2965(+)
MDDYDILCCDITDRATQVDFLGLTITLHDAKSISTKVFEKDLNFYQYIPPYSVHPPGVLSGLVLGMYHHISTLCSDTKTQDQYIFDLYQRLLHRGYHKKQLLPLCKKMDLPKINTPSNSQKLFLHIPYQPYSPQSHKVQQLWRTKVSDPPFGMKLEDISCHNKNEFECTWMNIAYSRPMNLGNPLSSRNIEKNPACQYHHTH